MKKSASKMAVVVMDEDGFTFAEWETAAPDSIWRWAAKRDIVPCANIYYFQYHNGEPFPVETEHYRGR